MALVMGVDSSTQSCKVVIVDAATGRIVRSGRATHPDGTSVDPEAWWSALQTAIADAGGIDDVEAWAIGGQQHGMVALDARGRVVRDALLWNDTRSAGAAADLIAEFGADELARRTGPCARGVFHDHQAPVAARRRTRPRRGRGRRRLAARLADLAPARVRTGRRGRGRSRLRRADHRPLRRVGHRVLESCDGAYDRDLVVAALGHDVALPRVLAPTQGVTDAAGRRVGAGAGDNAAPLWASGPRWATWSSRSEPAERYSPSVPSARSTPPARLRVSRTPAGHFLPLVATLNAARVLDAIARLLAVDHTELSSLAPRGDARGGRLASSALLRGRAHAEPP